jgi:hypothetical protein
MRSVENASKPACKTASTRPVQTLTTSQSANEDGKERFINEKTLNKMDGEIRNG